MDPIWLLLQYCVVAITAICATTTTVAVITLWIIMNWIITVIRCKTRLVEGVPDSGVVMLCLCFPSFSGRLRRYVNHHERIQLPFSTSILWPPRRMEWECPLSSSGLSLVVHGPVRPNGSGARRENSNPCPSLFKRPRSSIQLPANLSSMRDTAAGQPQELNIIHRRRLRMVVFCAGLVWTF